MKYTLIAVALALVSPQALAAAPTPEQILVQAITCAGKPGNDLPVLKSVKALGGKPLAAPDEFLLPKPIAVLGFAARRLIVRAQDDEEAQSSMFSAVLEGAKLEGVAKTVGAKRMGEKVFMTGTARGDVSVVIDDGVWLSCVEKYRY